MGSYREIPIRASDVVANGEIRWIIDVDMDPKSERAFATNPRFIRHRSRHQDPEWNGEIERRTSDVGNETRPALRGYEWLILSKKSTWGRYKRIENLDEWWILSGVNLVEGEIAVVRK